MKLTLASLILSARERMQISGCEAARRVGISASQLWQIEHGTFYPRATTLLKLCEALNLNKEQALSLAAGGIKK